MLLTLLLVGATLQGPAAPVPVISPLARVSTAIEGVVRERFGADARADVDRLLVRWAATEPAGDIEVVAEPGQRVGGVVRFLVYDAASRSTEPRRPIGSAQAAVRVTRTVVKAMHDVERGTELTLTDVTESRQDVGRMPFGSLPTIVEVVGGVARRRLALGDILTRTAVQRAPAIESGDEIVVRAVVGSVEAVGKAVAAQRGKLGDVIKVVNADSGRALKATVVGPGEVEVRHVR
ncbi:MAG: flagellar basal body P-ring formation chaperone FlgA [Vicinamibacterales bacterium]